MNSIETAKPCNIKIILDTYNDAIQSKRVVKNNYEKQNFNYGYYIFNFNLSPPEILNYMTNIFPNEVEPVAVYKGDVNLASFSKYDFRISTTLIRL